AEFQLIVLGNSSNAAENVPPRRLAEVPKQHLPIGARVDYMAAIERFLPHLQSQRLLEMRKHCGGGGNCGQPQSVPVISSIEKTCDGLRHQSFVAAPGKDVQKLAGLRKDAGAQEKDFANVRYA